MLGRAGVSATPSGDIFGLAYTGELIVQPDYANGGGNQHRQQHCGREGFFPDQVKP